MLAAVAAVCAAAATRSIPWGAEIVLRSGARAVAYQPDGGPVYLDAVNLDKWVSWRDGLPAARKAVPLWHSDNGPPYREGNHAPTFQVSGDPVEVREDSGPYKLGAQYVTQISDRNGDTQTVHFECTNDNPELFEKQPDIIACPTNFCTGTAEVPVATGTLIFTPRTDRFGDARVLCRARDSGIEYPVCNNNDPTGIQYSATFPCTPIECDTPGSDCNESPQQLFVIQVSPVNDCPEFVHKGDIVSPEDVEQCIENWAYQVTAGGWEEDYKQMDSQRLAWDVKNDNPSLFKTQPYIKYTQGSYTGDLCFTPADDWTGKATVQIYLTDDGGKADSGCDAKFPETITLTIEEVNDPPTFTPGPLKVVVEEDSGAHDIPWATQLSPGPQAEVDKKQELDTFVLEFINPAHADLFKVPPSISIETGRLTFEVADDANTFGIDCALTVHLVDTAAPPSPPAESAKPWPVLHIEITPINDPPSYVPPQPDKDVTVFEGQSVSGLQWAHDVCVGKAPPNCVVSEAYAGGENQKISFVLQATNQELFSTSPVLTSDGKLSFAARDDAQGTSVVTVQQFDSGPPPNQGPTHNFAIVILPVNDPPVFVTAKPRIEVMEDSGTQTVSRFLENLAPGPRDEWGQRLAFHPSLSPSDVLSPGMELKPQSQGAGPTFADLVFRPEPDRFGVVNLTFYIQDDGGTTNVLRWPAKVQKDAVGSLGMTIAGDKLDVTWVDPDKSAHAAGIREGMRIVAVSGAQVTTLAQANEAIAAAPDTGEFELTVQNGTDLRYGPLVQVHVVNVNDPPTFLKGDDIKVLEDHLPSRSTYLRWTHLLSAGPHEDPVQYVSFNCTHTPSYGLNSPGVVITAAGDMNFSLVHDFFGQVKVAVRVTDHQRGVDPSPPLSPWSEPQYFTITVVPVNDPPKFEIHHEPLTVTLCPPFEDNPHANCQYDLKGWAWGVSPGPENEKDQRLGFTLEPSLPRAEWQALFVAHHEPEVSEDGDLFFELAKGAAPSVSEFPVKVTLRDDGGTDDGGIDTNTATFTLRFVHAQAPPPAVRPSGVAVQQRVQTQVGSPVVTPTVFRVVDGGGGAYTLPNGTTVSVLLRPVPPTAGQASEWVYDGGGKHTFTPPPVSVYTTGTYRFTAEVHLPDGHILNGADDPFTLSSAGRIDASAYRDQGKTVVSDRSLNEWDLRGDDVKLVLHLSDNSWRPASLRSTVALHRKSVAVRRAASLNGTVTSTGTSGRAEAVNASQELQSVTQLESFNSLDTAGHLVLQLLRHPATNLLADAALVVTLPVGSVGGDFAPPPVEFALAAAPALRIVGGNMSEVELRTTGDSFTLRLVSGHTWMQQAGASDTARHGYVLNAIAAATTQQFGFNPLKTRLVSVTRVSNRDLRVTLGALQEYDIGVPEVVRVDAAQLRVVGGVQPDFDGTPSTLTIFPNDAATPAPGNQPTRDSGGLWAAASVLGVVVAVCALLGAVGATPLQICGPFAVAFVARCAAPAAESGEPDAVWRGLRWWAAPEAVMIGDGALPEAVRAAQGAIVVMSAVAVGCLVLHIAAVGLHHCLRPTDTEPNSFDRSAAALRAPSLWFYVLFVSQQLVLHNSLFLVFGSEAAAGWKAAGVIIAGFFTATALILSVMPLALAGALGWFENTDRWRIHGFVRFCIPNGIWHSHTPAAAHAAQGSRLRVYGVQRLGSMFRCLRPSRLWLQPIELLWLCGVNCSAAHCAANGGTCTGHAAAAAALTALFAVSVGIFAPASSRLLQLVRVVLLALLSLAAVLLAAGSGRGSSSLLDVGAVLLVACLVVAALLFLLSLAVHILTARHTNRNSSAGRGMDDHELTEMRSRAGSYDTRTMSVAGRSALKSPRPRTNPISVVFASTGPTPTAKLPVTPAHGSPRTGSRSPGGGYGAAGVHSPDSGTSLSVSGRQLLQPSEPSRSQQEQPLQAGPSGVLEVHRH